MPVPDGMSGSAARSPGVRNLADCLADGDSMPIEFSLDVVAQVCDALHRIHGQGLVHGDVRPATVWLSGEPGEEVVTLPAPAPHAEGKPSPYGNLVASAAYAAPEQIAGARVDGRADIFSAGVLLFELLSGRRPFEADSVRALTIKMLEEPAPDVRKLAPHVPDAVARAVATALQKDPARRYGKAAEFASDLRRAVPAGTRRAGPGRGVAPDASEDRLFDVPVRPRDTSGAPAFDLDPVLRSATHAPGTPAMALPPRGGEPRSRAVAVAASVAALALLSFAAWWFLRPGSAAVRLEIRSTPPGAAISLDGLTTSHRTPASIARAAFPARIGLSLDGYEPIDAAIDPPAGGTAHLEYRLRRLLQIESDPPGARVVLDGQETSRVTPAVVPIADPSALELRLEGYEAAHEAVTREALDAGRLFVKLTPAPAAEPGAEAVEVGPSPVAVTLSGGYRFAVSGCGANSAASRTHALQVTPPCTLRLRAPDYFLDVMRTVTATAGPALDLRAPALVRVQLRSRHENCLLLVAGRPVGSPPVDLEIAAGSYSATLQCPDGEVLQTSAFAIESGASVRRIDDYLR